MQFLNRIKKLIKKNIFVAILLFTTFFNEKSRKTKLRVRKYFHEKFLQCEIVNKKISKEEKYERFCGAL